MPDGDTWVAKSVAGSRFGSGSTPAEALADLAASEGLNERALAHIERMREAHIRDDAILEEIYQAKRHHQRRKAAERRIPNIIQFRRSR
ncbi:hypothetical protein [Microbacterium sp. Root53]|uniref:hypothetical protein n=1 Tax=Microbacterium sp. Root53 TaxID=1736553 RepID=UPI0012E397F9|nr:hypothetical protein [Microbacterium sp. Root53]